MKTVTIKGMPYVLKFNTRALLSLSGKGITIESMGAKMEKTDLSDFYVAFHEGIKTLRKDITFDDALDLIDDYIADENNSIEDLLFDVMEEIATGMGLGKKFKEEMQKQKEKEAEKA